MKCLQLIGMTLGLCPRVSLRYIGEVLYIIFLQLFILYLVILSGLIFYYDPSINIIVVCIFFIALFYRLKVKYLRIVNLTKVENIIYRSSFNYIDMFKFRVYIGLIITALLGSIYLNILTGDLSYLNLLILKG